MKARTLTRSTVLATLFLLVPAHADFHFMKIVEIFPGTAAAPNAQYVVLQMYVSGQQFVANHAVTVYAADGAQVASVSFPTNLPNGANQAKILVATTEAQAFFNVAPDLVMPAAVMAAGGKACFAGSVDCVAWGGWSGSSSGVGTPFNASGGLLSGQAAIRRLDIAGGATTLEDADDTGDSANDFFFGPPEPRNNAGLFGSIPSAVCGNDALEGLEQCDDGNQADGDGCSSTCAVEAGAQAAIEHDFDGDGNADVFWRNRADGRNVIWRSGNAGTPMSITGVSGLHWGVEGLGDFNGDGETDAFWRSQDSGQNVIWLSANAQTPQTTARVADPDWMVAGAGDFGGDGQDDVLWRNVTTGANVIWRSGSAATPQGMTGVGNLDWQIVGVGDFNGNGEDDIFWRNQADGRNVIWLSGKATTPQPTAGVANLGWQVVGVGDFDGDGSDDAFWRSSETGRNVIWRSGKASTPLAVTGVGSVHWEVADVADYNGDGQADAFWRHQADGRNSIWLSADATTQQAVPRVADLDWKPVPFPGIVPVEPEPDQGPVLTIADEAIGEGDSGQQQMVFTVRLSFATTVPVSYDVHTTDVSASAGSDYEAVDLPGETIPAGQTSRTFSVPVNGDTVEEGNESFNVGVSGVTGGDVTVGDGVAKGEIQDDDYAY